MDIVSFVVLGVMSSAAIAGYVLLLVQSARQHKQISQLQAQLNVFIDTSIAVAQSVDRLSQTGQSGDVKNVASRRWVLQEAKTRINKGETLLDIAVPLGLSRDEVRLLNIQMH